MAATPPRPISPVAPRPTVPQKSIFALQISPNLEALLQHDELTRRNSSSPTSPFHHPSPSSSGFPISLPPPPPRKAQGTRKREQDQAVLTNRTKDGQRKKALGSDFWSDALPQDGTAAGRSTPTSSSRPVTPNPYLNPAPTITTQPLPDTDGSQTPRPNEMTFPSESSRSRPSLSDPSCRSSSALNKVEKILWMGRDSFSLFSGSANGSKRNDSDRRNDRAECGDLDAVQEQQIRQVPVSPHQIVSASRPTSRQGDSDTATLSSRPGILHQRSKAESSETASTHSYSVCSESSLTDDDPVLPRPQPTPHLLPRLSLPSMSYDSPRTRSIDSVTGHDYLSFIDLLSPSTSDESHFFNIQDKSQEFSSSRRHPHSISISPASLYSASCYNRSSTSLASMRFAPPSPTTLALRPSSPISPMDSTSSVALSSMEFAPPSPSTERCASTYLQPFSGPPSPYSPLEFAPPPCSPQEAISRPFLPIAQEPASDRGRRFTSGKRSVSLSPHPAYHWLSPLPPTTNHLDATERADRIRRNRKLARVFGRTPGTDEAATDADEACPSKKSRSPSLAALLTKQKIHRHAVSVSGALKSPGMKTEPSTPWQTDGLWSPDGRRHSIPLTTGPLALCIDDQQDAKAIKDPLRRHNAMDSPESASTRSFIDLSDDDDVSTLSFLAPCPLRHQRLHQSSSTPSLSESFDSEAQAEAERRRKREKVARLHRFLGSRVPPEAIIGNVFGPPLPPAAYHLKSSSEFRVRGHKNVPLNDVDRGKEVLDEKEKALNVRRAQKMERVFGIPPPQMLFHTRPSRQAVPTSQPTSPTGLNPCVLTLDIPSSSRNPNQSAYMGKTIHRRGPSDSSRCLLPHIEDTQPSPSSFAQSFADSLAESLSGYQQVLAQSSVYLNYQHSLNSLVDIIDRDDRKSLVELHRFIHGGVDESPSEEEMAMHSPTSIATSFKSERRYSLPSKASMTSLSSDFDAAAKALQFQVRRRKAAKLTNFFGVDYRELIQDILESIEKGVDEEHKRGTLQPQEVEVLLHRVRSLRTIQDPFA